MVENISRIQQLLAEAKFVEVQQLIEQSLNQNLDSQALENLLELYFDCLKSQNKCKPIDKLIKLIEIKIDNNSDDVQKWLDQFNQAELQKYQFEILNLKINYYHRRGRLDDLYNTLRDFQNYFYEFRIPLVPSKVKDLIQKYFPQDFHLKVQALALDLLRMDLLSAESKLKELIFNSIINQTNRETKNKLNLLVTVLNTLPLLYQLDIYRNFCLMLTEGIKTKKDLKKIIECIIFIDDFKLQVIILKLLLKLNLDDVAASYVQVIKNNVDYDFVFLDKYLPDLKKYFVTSRSQKIIETKKESIDLTLEGEITPLINLEFSEIQNELLEHENLLSKLIKVQEFESETLLDLAVNFLQSDLNKTAIETIRLILEKSNDRQTKLRAHYLLATAYLKSNDYRAALDCCLVAMEMAESQNDILSFLYGQAEAYLKMKDKINAKKVLEKIVSIDRNYRLAKEKLEMIDAI
jgi:tetratricopeptide (TPR) repeat protein